MPAPHLNLLSSIRLLRHYRKGRFPSMDDIEESVFLDARDRALGAPDYLHKHTREIAFRHNGEGFSGFLFHALRSLAEPCLYIRNDRLFVKNEQLAPWQCILTRVPPIPLIGAVVRLDQIKMGRSPRNVMALCERILANSVLPSTEDPLLDAFIRDQGLHDLHLHLNGTTEFDLVWQDAMENPILYYKGLQTAFKGTVKEQLHQFGFGEPRHLFVKLRIAQWLRVEMTRFLFFEKALQRGKILRIMSAGMLSRSEDEPKIPLTKHPLGLCYPQAAGFSRRVQELIFMVKAVDALKEGHELFAHCLHCYFLIQSRLNMMLVQQETQVGFDQFQKITENKLRDPSEKTYEKRFQQMEGMYGPDLKYIEGRFAPKKTLEGNRKLISEILKGHENYCSSAKQRNLSTPELALVAHFIKKPEKGRGEFDCRHLSLRRENEVAARALLTTRRHFEDVRKHLCGADAAANELHAAPEVYAPTFRRLRRNGIQRMTFHVGEDFVHLISGIRAVYEAVRFLDMQKGDRIGHGTALGIDPDLWRQRISDATPLKDCAIPVSKGEWLDNLVFMYKLIRGAGEFASCTHEVQDEIYKLNQEIYSGGDVQLARKLNVYRIDQIIRAWEMRGLDPLKAFYDPDGKYQCLDIKERREWDDIAAAKKDDPLAFKLFKLYHSRRFRDAWDEKMEISLTRYPRELYIFLQNSVIKELNRRQVAIESMLSSNVRISFYKDYDEHHLTRWMAGPGGELEQPFVCLSTDDPGIFATTIRNEYKHAFNILNGGKDRGGNDDADAFADPVAPLRTLHRNAEAFRFLHATDTVAERQTRLQREEL